MGQVTDEKIFQLNFDGENYPKTRMDVLRAFRNGEKVTIVRDLPEKIIPGSPEAAKHVVDMINAANPSVVVEQPTKTNIFPEACFADAVIPSQEGIDSRSESGMTASHRPVFSVEKLFKNIRKDSLNPSELKSDLAIAAKKHQEKIIK